MRDIVTQESTTTPCRTGERKETLHLRDDERGSGIFIPPLVGPQLTRSNQTTAIHVNGVLSEFRADFSRQRFGMPSTTRATRLDGKFENQSTNHLYPPDFAARSLGEVRVL